MLRIKDDVDLKELEKFGFEYNEGENWYESRDISKHNYNVIYVFVNDNKELWTNGMNDTIFDLIQAGLVEKVDD